MKVALIVDEFSVEKGTGIARYSYELYKGLKDRGIEVEPIMVEPPAVPFGQAINHVFRLPYRMLRKVNEFDIVHATSPITGLCFPFIRKPKVMTYHDIISMVYKDSGNSLHARLAAPLFFRVGKWSDRIIAVSSQTKEEIVEHLGFQEEKITVINLGLDDGFEPIEKGNKNHFTIGYLGAFAPRKRVNYLIMAFYHLKKEHPDILAKLALCGKKNLEYDNLVKLVKELGLEDYVEFRGFIPQEKLNETYNSFDVFAIMSKWEGFCIPILEAQRCRVPVIVRKDARIPTEVLYNCIKVNSEKNFVDTVYNLSIRPNFMVKNIINGFKYSKKFSWSKTIEQTIDIYKNIQK